MLSLVACSPVVGIELHAGFRRVDLHRASADGIGQLGGKAHFALLALVQHVAVVVSGSVLDLFVVGIDVLSNGLRCAEVERRALNEADFARWDACLVDGDVEIGVDFENLVVDGGSGVGDSLKREESMAGQVDDGLLVGGCHVFDNQFVIVVESVDNRNLHFARVAFFTIGAHILQHECLVVHLQGFPHLGVEAFLAAVERVGTIVDRQIVFLAVQLELTLANAVAVASDEGGEIGFRAVYHALDGVVTLNHIAHVAVFVGHHDGDQCSAIVGDGHFVTQAVLQDVEIRLFSVYCGLEIFFSQATNVFCFNCVHDKNVFS